MPELQHYSDTGRQSHSSMNNISQLVQHTLEVTDLDIENDWPWKLILYNSSSYTANTTIENLLEIISRNEISIYPQELSLLLN